MANYGVGFDCSFIIVLARSGASRRRFPVFALRRFLRGSTALTHDRRSLRSS